ncbi:MAG: alpha/beta hydrolase, partial [Actinobacteria bacterium]|nr:alpha/beta hydrolase [Actinomycetota bacterium]
MQRVEVVGTPLEYEESGEGQALLFLHGEDGLIFSAAVREQLAANFRVIAPHHPGWGGSGRGRHLVETADLARMYAAWLEGFEAPPIVVGCSFGAWLAAEVAALRPAGLAGLVLIAPTGLKLGGRDEREFADIWMADMEGLRDVLYADAAAAPALAELSDDDFRYLAQAQEATARYCWQPYMHNPRLAPWLGRVVVPTLLVHGTEDRFALLPDYYERYAGLIGEGARVESLPGVGHRVEEEAPALLAELIRTSAAVPGADTPVLASRK